MKIDIMGTNAGLGAEVRGIDIHQPVSPDQRKELAAAWREYPVLLIRGEPLSDDQLLAFARSFGDLQLAPVNENSDKFGHEKLDYPEIAVVSNILENDKPIGGLGSGEAFWHTDSSFLESPTAGSFLHALEIPPSGGDTSFANMYLAYEALPDRLRSRIAGRQILHDLAHVASGALKKGHQEVTDVSQGAGPRHPIARHHPDSGRTALYLGRRLKSYVVGLPVPESEELLDELWAHATQPKFVWTHKWRVGDLVFWDNRCTTHRRDSFGPKTRRLMHRAQTQGEAPISARVGTPVLAG